MASDIERELFASRILTPTGQQSANIPEQEVSGFLAMVGRSWGNELMIVGRAVNGWMDGVSPTHLSDPAIVNQYARQTQDSVAEGACCSMQWVTDRWGASEGYNTKRSAFWRSVRDVVHDLDIADVDSNDWPSHLVWSNLYKLSPPDGGNPSNALCDIQFPGCSELLELEIQTYQPKRILFLTGTDWASPFLKEAPTKKEDSFQHVQGVGNVLGAPYVIASHPQGKPQAEWVKEVVNEFGL